MSYTNRADVDQCPLTHDQLACNCPDCDSRPNGAVCPILESVKARIAEAKSIMPKLGEHWGKNMQADLNARIEAGVREIYNQYSPSWQHTRNQPGSKF